ncbi:amino acid/amide ABC transporter membrane protein 2, HAAT family (TC 3.A.1.4.-) [Tessaracoccus bendigoensis DSM 12906]|uniref:Amino acid/amide ABC transporter membrane protein 2, HAAT family (TC 3.A.1.4.-) n=1 Tax=Tessaracoccus bendigoensis DSM 12906 TaxID=1123357 RepID=A0A1M6F123_9ACTN|nr:branched-chain amino acid ABC transporter permease [Tessaracoccus bendigoensis]SHI91428.1 amino acid/amide ABC transporter membrane protein 2, HAAT family (TC 3.A.1.4.-) [Tessaracoccus bendigoensis DSM 12906]
MATFKRVGLRALPFVASYLIVLGLMNAGVINDYVFSIIVTICVNIILASSLNLVTGFTGQFSLGHAGFMAVGAYTCALICINLGPVVGEVPAFLIGMFAGALAAAVIGTLVGLPTLRLRGDYLAIATLGMAEIIRVVMLNLHITNGAAGLSGIPQVVDWNWVFLFTALTLVVLWNYIRSSQGRRAIAVREDEIAAEAIGVNTTAAKVQAFTIGAFFAGIGGGLYASYFFLIKPDQFGFLKSIDILVIVVLGGLGSLSGTVIAAILLAIVSTVLAEFSDVRMIIYSLVLVLIMIFRPGGLMGSREISDTILGRVFKRGKATEGAL